MDRRGFMKKSLAVSGIAAAALSLEEKILMAQESKKPEIPAPDGAGMPKGKIGHLEISRLICGGNLISGFAHSRDLVYVSELFKRYFTEEKVFETLKICEANGINTLVTSIDVHTLGLMEKYRKNGGKIQWIAQICPNASDPIGGTTKQALDAGVDAVHVQGLNADQLIRDEDGIKALKQVVAKVRSDGRVCGIGAHLLSTIKSCEEKGIDCDYYMKTFHHHNYWSAGHPVIHDSQYDLLPDETKQFMQNVSKPWIAFKVLAAGAISPTSGFKYVLTNGADFMCVGMFDFQIADDVQIVKGLFSRGIKREREWRG